MPNIQDRQGLGSEELQELSKTGPFGGTQSEMPISAIDKYGFASSSNVVFRLGRAIARPGITPDGNLGNSGGVGGKIVGFYNFQSNTNGAFRVALQANPNGGLYVRGLTNWGSPIAGGTVLGGVNKAAMASLNGLFCYSDSSTALQTFDGTTINNTITGAPKASNMAEIALHLVAGNTNTGPFTYEWSGVGDPTDWTSFSSGQNNYSADLGPINGILKLGQIGYGFHFNGIIQIIPTGIGTVPFEFEPLQSAKKGVYLANTLSKFELGGLDCCAFVGQGNVYMFNQTQCQGIGDAPIQGRSRIGARQAIMADVYNASVGILNFANVLGIDSLVTENLRDIPYKAYWLFLRNVVWIFNLEEENWARYSLGPANPDINLYSTAGLIDFEETQFTDALLSPYPSVALGKSFTVYKQNFSVPSEGAMSLTSGKITFEDVRHKHTIKKLRLRFTDLTTITYTVTLTNEKGVSETQVVTLGTGSGDDLSYIFSFSLNGLRFQYNISAPATASFAIIEIAPYYDTSGEQRGGVVDN